MELPMEKQIQVMNTLRRFSIRETAQLHKIPKSTVQNYKKYGPPFFRRLKKDLSIEVYPASIVEENDFFKRAAKEVIQQAKLAVRQRNIMTNKTECLQQSNVQKDRIIKTKEDENIRLQQEKEQLKTKLVQEVQKNQALIRDNNQLEKINNYLKSENDQKIQSMRNLEIKFQKMETELTKKNESLARSNEMIDDITKERDQYKNEAWDLKLKQNRVKRNYVAISVITGVVGFVGGVVVDHYLNPASEPIYFDRHNLVPIQQSNIDQSITHNSIDNVVPLVISSSGNSCSGSFSNIKKDYNTSGYTIYPNKQDIITQSGDQKITPTVNTENDSFKISCSGAYPNRYEGNICSGCVSISHQQDSSIPIDNLNKATIETNIAPRQYPEVYFNSHLETSGSIPYMNPMKEPPFPPMTTPIFYSYTPLNPLFDPLHSPIMQRLWEMKWFEFEWCLKGFFEFLGYHVELTPASHDKGADLIATRGPERIVIQAKQWKANVGTAAIQQVFAAKTFYDANHALVITTSKFSSSARKLADKLGVELWNCEQLLEEWKNRGFYF